MPRVRTRTATAVLAALSAWSRGAAGGLRTGGGLGAIGRLGRPVPLPRPGARRRRLRRPVGRRRRPARPAPCATVTTVLASSAVDPHDYEPSTGDHRRVSRRPTSSSSTAPATTRGPSARSTGSTPARPWSPRRGPARRQPRRRPAPLVPARPRPAGGRRVTAGCAALAPADAGRFDEQAATFRSALSAYDDALAALRPLAAGRTYAATETVFDRTAARARPDRRHPARLPAGGEQRQRSRTRRRRRARAGAAPTAAVDVLVVNTQTEGNRPPRAARPTAEPGPGARRRASPESPPGTASLRRAGRPAQLDQLAAALGRAR